MHAHGDILHCFDNGGLVTNREVEGSAKLRGSIIIVLCNIRKCYR